MIIVIMIIILINNNDNSIANYISYKFSLNFYYKLTGQPN